MIETIRSTIGHVVDQLALWVMLAALAGVITLTVLPFLERGRR